MKVKHDEFQKIIKHKGRELYRDMPWRSNTNPYYILVSELMLQQTQVSRVIPKFEAFMAQFPDSTSLAAAPLSDVLKAWSGLGYNRRAKYLHDAAKIISSDYNGSMPSDLLQLKRLPGIGPATAGAIMVYAFNRPVVFIETNVRTVYFYHYFAAGERVSDAQLVPLVRSTLDETNPRAFYWALMDYGTWLKQGAAKRTNGQSLHYKKQSSFNGSVRQVRGQILHLLADGDQTLEELKAKLPSDGRLEPALNGLLKDGLITQAKNIFGLTK